MAFKIGHISWNRGKKATEETKQRMRKAKIGSIPWNKGVKQWEGKESPMLGREQTVEARLKMSIAKTGTKLGPRSKEIKNKIGKANSVHMQKLWEKPEYKEGQKRAHIGYVYPVERIAWKRRLIRILIKIRRMRGKRTPEERKVLQKRCRQKRRALEKGGGKLLVSTIQRVYEDNIKKYGTLTCYLCEEPIPFGNDALEHKIPLSRGGTNRYDNLGIACKSCNCKKHTKTEKEYRFL